MQFFAFGFRIVTFSPSTCETPVCIWKWPEEQRLSSSANPLEANPAAMACHTAQPGTGTCSSVVFSRLFWKLNLISGDFLPFFFLHHVSLHFPHSVLPLILPCSANTSHFSTGFLLGCLTNCPLCGRARETTWMEHSPSDFQHLI